MFLRFTVAPAVIPSFALAFGSEAIKRQCEWDNDYSMVAYCFEKQEAAQRSLESAASDLPGDVALQIRSDCKATWGSDFSMVSYCIEKQAAAWKALQ